MAEKVLVNLATGQKVVDYLTVTRSGAPLHRERRVTFRCLMWTCHWIGREFS